jgi:hypothetical protein
MVRMVLIDGCLEMSASKAAKYIGCAQSTIYLAIRNKRYCVLQHSVTWKNDIHKPYVQRKRGHKCIVDGIEYESAKQAAIAFGFIVSSLCHALDMQSLFHGHSIMWANEE